MQAGNETGWFKGCRCEGGRIGCDGLLCHGGTGARFERTRETVLKVADELGFVRNEAAANLRSGQSRLIGVILNNIANPFQPSCVRAGEHRLERRVSDHPRHRAK